MPKQALITNYFANNHPAKTTNHTLEDNPPRNFIIKHSVLSGADHTYTATLPGGVNGPLAGGCFASLELYEDQNGDQWINHIETAPQAQRCGLATRLCVMAIQQYGTLYASNSQYDPGGDDDTRHLSQEGAALVTRLIQRNIMQAGWLRAPVI